jgi:hypothetical protein
MIPELKRIAKQTIVGIGFLSGYITIKIEYLNGVSIGTLKATIQEVLAKSAEEAKNKKVVKCLMVAKLYSSRLRIANSLTYLLANLRS